MKSAIFGGAFDPPHLEHKRLPESAIKELDLDRIILVPSVNPPHKDNEFSSFEDRLNMLKIMFSDNNKIIIDTIENDDDHTHCSYQIIAKLKEKYPDDELFFLVGGDSIANFHTWVHPEIIAKEITLVSGGRTGYEDYQKAVENIKKDYNGNIITLDYLGKNISSSEIKARCALDYQVTEFIDPNVYQYIKEHNLYNKYDSIIDKLKLNIVSDRLLQHCFRTAIYAVRFATKAHVSVEKAFIAGLLHDCAKESAKELKNYPTTALSVVHQYAGAEVAEGEYHICDTEILDAIRYHTTGRIGMTNLEKLIYIADKLEDNRNFDGIDELRESVINEDIDHSFKKLLCHSLEYLHSKDMIIDDMSEKCYNYYK